MRRALADVEKSEEGNGNLIAVDAKYESISDRPVDCYRSQDHAQIIDTDIRLAMQSGGFLERVAAWFCMAVILPALAQATKEYVVKSAICKDPPLCASVPRVVEFFPAHIVSAAVLILAWNTCEGARRGGWAERWWPQRRKPLWRLSAIPPSLQSDHSLYQDVDILFSRISGAAQTRRHSHVGRKKKAQRSLFCQGVVTTVSASLLIGLAWVPFFALSSALRLRFEECVRSVDLQGYGEASFEKLMECEIENAVKHHGLVFTDEHMNSTKLAKAEASAWKFNIIDHFSFLPYFIQACNLYQLTPVEIFGGVLAGGYVLLTTLVRIEMEKVKSRACLAKTQMHDEFRHCSPVSSERILQGAGEEPMELPSLLEAYTMVMKEVLPSPACTSAKQLVLALLLISFHLTSTSLTRASTLGGRMITLPPHMQFFALCNQVSVLACSVHFYLKSTHAALVYRRSIPRLQAWRAMWHRRTCVLFRDHVDGLSHGRQKESIRDGFIFLHLDTLAEVDVWRRMQGWVRLEVLQDRIEAEGLVFVSAIWMMMLFAMRMLFVLFNLSVHPAPTLWLFLAIDILVFGRPLLHVLATCSDIASEHKLDLQYLSELREDALRRDGSALQRLSDLREDALRRDGSYALSHLFASVISKEAHTQEYEKLLSITITPGVRTAACAVVACTLCEVLAKFAFRVMIKHFMLEY